MIIEKNNFSKVNKSFAVCSSYPEQTIVPSLISDQMLTSASKIRLKGRFPVLTYLHEGTPLVRATHPVQARPRRCVEVLPLTSHLCHLNLIRTRR